MRRVSHRFVALAAVVGLAQIAVYAAYDDDEMVKNPPYTHWSVFKPGTTVTQRETVKFAEGSDGREFHGDARVHDFAYKLLEVTPERVVVQMIIFDHTNGSVTEHAPLKITFPAMAKKEHVLRGRNLIEKFTERDEDVKVKDKMVKTHVIDILDTDGDESVERHIWRSGEIPGGTVKDVKTTKKGEKVLAETKTEVLEFHIEH
jgi:hypothetical protein